jgi:serine/threonine protein kinase
MLRNNDLLDNTYRIIEQIGSGGGGIIYKAEHIRLQKEVVVKLIRDNVKDKINERAEADILKKLKHTYLPQVYDFLTIDDNVYTIMDFIPGKSFEEELKEGKKFTQHEIIKWAKELCEALKYLHEQNPPIIHSDIKSANIMHTPTNDICLIDFNISLLFHETRGIIPYEQGL